MKALLLLDTETTGLDPAKDRIIEIGAVLWRGTTIESWSTLVRGSSNEAEAINRIPAAALAHGMEMAEALEMLNVIVASRDVDVLVAHNAPFDAGFLAAAGWKPDEPWVDTRADILWPQSKLGDSLVVTALAHGIAVASAHRALTDCRLLAALFDRMVEVGQDVDAMVVRALRPKATYQAIVSYDDREKAKGAGFSWDAATKRWLRRMAKEDVDGLGFQAREVSA